MGKRGEDEDGDSSLSFTGFYTTSVVVHVF